MRGLPASQACKYGLAAWLVTSMFLAGCAVTPPAMRAPSDRGGLRLRAQVIDPEVLAEWLDDVQAPERIVVVEVTLHNVGPGSYTVTPSRASLIGPRNQRIRSVEPAALPRHVKTGSQGGGRSTPPFVDTRQESERAVVADAGEKALRPHVLAPGDASEGWLYFPIAGRGAAKEVPHRWRLVVLLDDENRRSREYLVRIGAPDESLQ